MIALLLGVVCLVALMTMLGMFSRAQIATLKSFGIWIAAIGGVALAAMLAFTKGPEAALAALVLLGPLVWSWMVPQSPRGRTHRPGRGPSMTRAEAYEVLGLKPGASTGEIRAAHRRLMRAAHPDSGGSDWLATRINQARDTLLH